MYPSTSRPGAVAGAVELMRVTLDGRAEQLTHSRRGTLNYHPTVFGDGRWLVLGSNRSGARNLYVMPSAGGKANPVTRQEKGQGAMWAHWQSASR